MTTTNVVTVRPADAADLTSLVEVDGLGSSTRGLLVDDLARSDRVVVAAEIAGTLVGMGMLMIGLDEDHVLDLAVNPDVRRRGIGSRLLAELISISRREDSTRALTLEVRDGNVAARGLYEAAGFEVEGRRAGYYPATVAGGEREDALIMWCRTDVEA